jgi:septal ring factor EnvC (AmiA/AmiB activator)
MLNTTTIFFVALLALAAAGVAIVWISKLSKHLSELGRSVLESQDIGRIKEAANKIESFDSRMAGCEHKADESQNHLTEHKTKLSELAAKLEASEQKTASFDVRFDELATKLESVEQMANKNEAGLAEAIPSIKALADEIQILQKFQTATEKSHSLIQAAFTDMQASIPPEESLGTTPETTKPEEASQEPEELQEETKDPKMSGSRRWNS